jgi:hypothetical protein
MYVPHRKHLWISTACYVHRFTFLYVADVRASQETHLWTSTACYVNRFTFLYVADVSASQETHLWISTACYVNRFTFLYVADVRASQETHLWTFTACYGDSICTKGQCRIGRENQAGSVLCLATAREVSGSCSNAVMSVFLAHLRALHNPASHCLTTRKIKLALTSAFLSVAGNYCHACGRVWEC